MTSTRWHRTQRHGGGEPISVGRSFIRRRGSWDRRCSGVEGGHREWFGDDFIFRPRVDFLLLAIHLFLSETPFRPLSKSSSHFLSFLPSSFLGCPTVSSSKGVQVTPSTRYPVRASSLFSAEACAERPGSGNLIYWADGSASAQPTKKEDR